MASCCTFVYKYLASEMNKSAVGAAMAAAMAAAVAAAVLPLWLLPLLLL